MHVERPNGSRAMSRGSPCEGPGLRQQAAANQDSNEIPALPALPAGTALMLPPVARPTFLERPAAVAEAAAARLRPLAARVGPPVARFGPLVPLWLAGAGLILSEFLTYREIVAVTVVPQGGITKGGSHHGYALGLLGLASLPMSFGAVIGRSRPASAAVAVLGGLAL